MSVDDKELEEAMPVTELEWTETAIARMKNVPFFVRKGVVRGIEQYAKDKGVSLVDDDVVSRARQEREGDAIRKRQEKEKAKAQAGELPSAVTLIPLQTTLNVCECVLV